MSNLLLPTLSLVNRRFDANHDNDSQGVNVARGLQQPARVIAPFATELGKANMLSRLAFWVNVFPARYETFIASQIEGMLDRGWNLEIIARKKGPSDNSANPALLHSVEGRTVFRPIVPSNRWARILKTPVITVNVILKKPRALSTLFADSVDTQTAGRLGLLYESLPFVGRRPHDIVFCAYGPLGNMAVALKSAGIISGRIVTAFRGSDLSQGIYEDPKIYNRLFEVGDLFLPVSDVFKSRLLELGCPESKIAVHHDSVDCSAFSVIERKYTPGEPLRLIAVGRLIEKKGFEYAIRALALVKQKIPHVKLHVVGDGPLKTGLLALIEELGLSKHVEILGWMSHAAIVAELERAHIMIQPSVTGANGDQEGIPTVLKEALASGLPVVATRHSGNPELVIEGVTGHLVPERDVDALAARVVDLADAPQRWNEMGRAGRTLVEQEYDIPVQNERLHGLFMKLANNDESRA